ncbi:DUF3987 domain-containing protein [uncultured Shimia sp.]|uniref:DUF3987 domain-containing protein n=1 Tax=uncultured Shimia sp. TaxID=573152 RepID=UPI0026068FFC|nr:DUF3987 domain-containing protein [uncultured Shimia sp.]
MSNAAQELVASFTANHDLARRLASAGLPVFPCRAADAGKAKAKSPLTSNGFKAASTDAEQIDRWWQAKPEAVVGMPTGAVSGISVLDGDIDRLTGEAVGESQLESLGLLTPSEVKVRTQSMGIQLLFAHVDGAKTSSHQVASHVDTRGDGGYIIAPGSVMASGARYTYEGRSLAEALSAGDLPSYPVEAVNAAIAAAKARKAGTQSSSLQVASSQGWSLDAGHTAPTDEETLEATRLLLSEAPNTLGREDWVKLAMSLRVAFGGALQGDFLSFSLRYSGGSPCSLQDAQVLWNSAGSPSEVSSIAPALGLLKEALGPSRTKKIWGEIMAQRDATMPLRNSHAKVATSPPLAAEGPQPLLRELPESETYPVSALGPLQSAVEAAHDITQAPIAIAAQSALSVASLAVQAFADVETMHGLAPISLYCLTVAQSGERKSATDKVLMAGLKDFEREQAAEYRDDLNAWKGAQALWKADHDKIMGEFKKKSGNRVAAQADLDALGEEPPAPLSPNLTSTEPTLEGLHKLYASGQPALGVFSDEGGQFLGGHAMSSDNRLKTVAGLSALWGGDPINRTRAGDGASTLYSRRLAAHLMVQPIVARPLLSDPVASGQGFLARFLITEPPSAIGHRLKRGHSEFSSLAELAFAQRLKSILCTPKPTADDNPQELMPRQLPLSSAAKELLWRYYQQVEKAQASGGEFAGITAFASKSPEQAARIAGALTLWDDLSANEVTPETMAHALTLAGYYLSEAKRLAEAAEVSTEIDQAEQLRLWLLHDWPAIARSMKRSPDTILLGDVSQRGPNSLRVTKTAKSYLAILETHGWVRRLPEGAEVDGIGRRLAYQIVRA